MSDEDVITEIEWFGEDDGNLTTTGFLSTLKLSEKLMDSPSGVLELGTEIDTEAVSKKPKPAESALTVRINFYNAGKNLLYQTFSWNESRFSSVLELLNITLQLFQKVFLMKIDLKKTTTESHCSSELQPATSYQYRAESWKETKRKKMQKLN